MCYGAYKLEILIWASTKSGPGDVGRVFYLNSYGMFSDDESKNCMSCFCSNVEVFLFLLVVILLLTSENICRCCLL